MVIGHTHYKVTIRARHNRTGNLHELVFAAFSDSQQHACEQVCDHYDLSGMTPTLVIADACQPEAILMSSRVIVGRSNEHGYTNMLRESVGG